MVTWNSGRSSKISSSDTFPDHSTLRRIRHISPFFSSTSGWRSKGMKDEPVNSLSLPTKRFRETEKKRTRDSIDPIRHSSGHMIFTEDCFDENEERRMENPDR
jgi:hypothetical protein